MPATKRPNILFLMTDQQRHDALGSANPVYRTPALDRLAARGVRFSQAVCNVPMCVPSRYSMMTGLYGFQCGVKHNAQMVTRDPEMPVPTLAERLRAAGYQTAGFGKTHWYIGEAVMPGVPVEGSRRGFEVRALRGSKGPNNDEAGGLYMADDRPDWHGPVAKEQAGGGPGGESVPGYVGATSAIPGERQAEGWLTDKALDFLERGRDPARPFFMYLSLDYPHVPLFVPPGFEELYDLADFPDNPPPEPVPGGHVAGHRFEEIWPAMSPDERRRSRLRYAALCSYTDSLFGRVLDRLEALGELENTFVLFTSDHGDMLGDRGRVTKYSLYEGSVRVPLIVAGPGVASPGMVDERPAELVDVVPTLLDAAGLEIPDALPGLSLLSDAVRPGSFAEMHGRGYEEYQRAPAVMYRTAEWKLILHLPGRLGEALPAAGRISGELYRLADDPLELNNCYADAACAQVRERLTAQALMHLMCSVGRFPSAPSRARVRVTGPETKPDRSIWPQP
ncbi:MAG TPA: sulfatase-like hydrolase/transferase [Planctomycetota bacterium]|nr:sulfatase-like hydrolase/transferase [Planctomycetota bacterium]